MKRKLSRVSAGAAAVLAVLFFAACGGDDDPISPYVVGLSIDTPPKNTSYTVGEGFSSGGLVLFAAYSDGSGREIRSGWTLSWSDAPLEEGSTAITGSEGKKTVTVAYGDKTVTFSISVSATDPVDSVPPADVSGLSAAVGIGQITLLTWSDPADSDLDHIEITWSEESVTAEKSTADDRANSKAVTGLTNGITYTFTVKAVDTSGNKSQGKTASAIPTGTDMAIASTDNWTNALAQISADSDGTSSNPKVYTLDIQGDIPVPGVDSSENSVSGNYKTVRLTGSGTLSIASSGSIFRVDSTQTLIIDGPTLSGRADNYTSVVHTGNGTVELRTGTISGNTIASSISVSNTTNVHGGIVSSYGGGVYVDYDGTFIMTGGTISDNTITSTSNSNYTDTYAVARSCGGGVYVNGTFTMTGGTISDNTITSTATNPYANAYSYGGGVYVDSSGTFTMSGGTISGNNAAFYPSSSYPHSGYPYYYCSYSPCGGGGVGVGVYYKNNGGNNEGGTFTMNGGTISGNNAAEGGGVYVVQGTFTKTGGTIYGDTDSIVENGNDTGNTATAATYPGKNGHAALYTVNTYRIGGSDAKYIFYEYYHNETLGGDANGNISTTDTLPTTSGEVLNNWTMRY